ncbi:MAG: solute carrier family 35, member E3 [Candidatus Peregrinibacteria bacterium Greene0416_62]|nr:MAG: solute carrier family 35, member E3 [Candidatus Peregrinibacteria bacterium Greene0416_62]TSD00154.1 MAG: solute carrier family 35, member E3 [Candidatus Peregrinibacteria bacterium Greene1014_49]
MSILLFGSRGFIGTHMQRRFPDAIASNIDIADSTAVAEEFDHIRPDIAINCVGKTGTPNVDWCEDHKEETFRSNVTGPLVLMEECRKRGIYWVHISSGCVYSGDNGGRGYSEDDAPNFQGSFYSRTKQWTDAMLNEFADPAEGKGGILMLRIRMPFQPENHPKNLLTKIAKFTKVIDVQNSVTYIPDFLDAVSTLIDRRRTGIFHMVNPGSISLYDVACRFANAEGRPHPERLPEYLAKSMTKAARSNCVLSTEKLSSEGICLPNAMKRMEEILERRARTSFVSAEK